MSVPEVRVEVAFETTPDNPSPVWEDVTSYVDLAAGVSITRGRQDEFSQVQPSTCSLTLDNSDGRFTAGLSSSPYYPNVKIGKQIRVWSGSVIGNFLSTESASFEGGTTGDWSAVVFAPYTPTISVSSTRANFGTKSLKATWPAGSIAGGSAVTMTVGDLHAGRTYTYSAYGWVPASGVGLQITSTSGGSASTSTTGAWQRISVSFTAASSTEVIYLSNATGVVTGNDVWVDGIMINEGSTAQTFTTSPASPRFTGYVDEWPVAWSPIAASSDVTVTASDRFKRLGTLSAFRSVIEEEIISGSPTSYFTLGEDSDSTTAGDSSGAGAAILSVTQVGTGGTLAFGDGTGPGTDGLTAPIFTPSSTSNGKFLRATGMNFLGGSSGLSLRAAFNTSTSAKQTVARASWNSFSSTYLELRVTAAGKIEAAVNASTGEVAVTSSGSVVDGLTHDAVVTVASDLSMTLYLDGSVAGTGTAPDTTPVNEMNIGGITTGQLFTGTISHVATYDTAVTATQVSDQWHAVHDGFSGDSSDERIARYAGWAGLTDADLNLEAGDSTSVAFVDTTGTAPVQAMQDIASTENGVLFIAGDGRLTFHARSHRYGASTAATLDEIGEGDTFVVNDQQLINDVTASRSGGIAYRAVASDSVTDYGSYRQDVQLLTTSDNEVVDAANWIANSKSMPQPRLPQLTIDLLTNTAIRTDALALEIGSLVSLSGLPPQAPDAASDFFIEGWTESISTQDWSLVCNTSPAGQTSVWVLDDSVFSVLGQTTTLAY